MQTFNREIDDQVHDHSQLTCPHENNPLQKKTIRLPTLLARPAASSRVFKSTLATSGEHAAWHRLENVIRQAITTVASCDSPMHPLRCPVGLSQRPVACVPCAMRPSMQARIAHESRSIQSVSPFPVLRPVGSIT